MIKKWCCDYNSCSIKIHSSTTLNLWWIFDDIPICDNETIDEDLLWLWWIYVLELDIVWLHDLTVLLMHNNIMIDKLMPWLMLIEVASHTERETLHKIPTLIIICRWLLTVEARFLDMINHLILLKLFWQILIWAEKVSLSSSPICWEKGLRVRL